MIQLAEIASVEIESHVQQFLDELDVKIKAILEEWGLNGERLVKEEITRKVYDTPPSDSYKRTGRLRSSINYKTKQKTSPVQKPAESQDGVDGDVDDRSVIIGTNVEYAAYVEYGTSKMPARSYLRDGLEPNMDKFKEIAEKILDDG